MTGTDFVSVQGPGLRLHAGDRPSSGLRLRARDRLRCGRRVGPPVDSPGPTRARCRPCAPPCTAHTAPPLERHREVGIGEAGPAVADLDHAVAARIRAPRSPPEPPCGATRSAFSSRPSSTWRTRPGSVRTAPDDPASGPAAARRRRRSAEPTTAAAASASRPGPLIRNSSGKSSASSRASTSRSSTSRSRCSDSASMVWPARCAPSGPITPSASASAYPFMVGEWRSQLVRDRHEEVPLAVLTRGEGGREVIERRRYRGHLGGCVVGARTPRSPAGEPAGRDGDLAQRSSQPPSEQEAGEHAGQQAGAERDPQPVERPYEWSR